MMVIQAFLGAFAAMVALAEVRHENKLLRYLFALIVGLVVAVVLSIVAGWIGRVFPNP
jgi:ABC-type uncharacterized transport system permease subunit